MRTLMLRFGEVARVGDDISVCLIGIHGQCVTLRIEAPGRMAIAAAELVKTPLPTEQDHPSGSG